MKQEKRWKITGRGFNSLLRKDYVGVETLMLESLSEGIKTENELKKTISSFRKGTRQKTFYRKLSWLEEKGYITVVKSQLPITPEYNYSVIEKLPYLFEPSKAQKEGLTEEKIEIIKRCEEAFEKVKERFPVIINEGDYDGWGSWSKAMRMGSEQWREIKEFLRRFRLSSFEIHVLFQACRSHYNWRGWMPSVTDLVYAMRITES